MTTRILCATDGSHSAEKAVDVAVDLAKGLNAELTFLTVERDSAAKVARQEFWDSTVLDAADAQVSRELRVAMGKARAAGLERVSCVIAYGHNIAAAIVEYAGKHGHDHIVTGSLGLTGAARLLLGSIAAEVVAKAHCPVTVVR